MLAIGAALVCVAANAFFVAAEFAFAKVRPSALKTLVQQGDRQAARALDMTERLDAFLSATQLGITLASLALGWLGKPAVATLLYRPLHAAAGVLSPVLDQIGVGPDEFIHGAAYALAFATISLFHIVIGELVPKSIAIQYPEQVSRVTSSTLLAFSRFTAPAMWVLNGLSNAVLRLFRLPPVSHTDGKLSAEEIRIIIRASFGESEAAGRKRELLERVLRGTDRPVRAIMIPRVDMVTVPLNETVEHCLELVRRYGFSRYPLCEAGDPDKVLGYVHIKDILTAAEDDIPLESLKRDILYVPESTKVGDVLSEFQQTALHIAIVVDEYGGTDGLVTLEDVVEEMVGEIQDEHDPGQSRTVTQDNGRLKVFGSLPLHDLELQGLRLSEGEDPDTVGGLIVGRLGRLARPGDRVNVGQYQFLVEDVRRRRISRVAIRPLTEPPPEPTPDDNDG